MFLIAFSIFNSVYLLLSKKFCNRVQLQVIGIRWIDSLKDVLFLLFILYICHSTIKVDWHDFFYNSTIKVITEFIKHYCKYSSWKIKVSTYKIGKQKKLNIQTN